MESETETLLDAGRGGLVTARGTSEGLIIRLDGRVDRASLKSALSEFMEPRRSFLAGHDVTLEWVGLKPESAVADEISTLLQGDYKVMVKSSKLRAAIAKQSASINPEEKPPEIDVPADLFEAAAQNISQPVRSQPPRSLFHGMNEFEATKAGKPTTRASADPGKLIADPLLWDDPDARMIYATLRSGQRIESEHSIILVGDVNPGGEIVAGGDIVVLGSLRGIAHAGAYEETGGGHMIFALNLNPTQLRIGSVISRGSEESRKEPEMARVDGNLIVVEPFNTKNSWLKRPA